MDNNILLTTDSYKISHWKQYPPKTTRVYSYFESRGGRFPEVVFFGLQYIMKRYLEGVVVTKEKIAEAKEFYNAHFGNSALFNEEGWNIILNDHNGRLPLKITAVPEGTIVGVSNVLMTVENLDPRVPWLTNYVETLLSQVWYPCTVATQSREMRKTIMKYLAETGDPSLVDFKMHDFGFRGSTSVESAGIGGAAHLTSFMGTDTIAALEVARKYYGENMAGFSIPAAEHSTITSWGKENEAKAYRNMLEQYPSGLVAVVSDSYDIMNAVENIWGKELKAMVEARDGVLVVRPDSGNPPDVVAGVLNALGESFGSVTNEKGFRVLNPKVRVIQGDGIDYAMLNDVLFNMRNFGWSADNIAFGSGGGLLQKMNRDTQKFAFKCSAIEIDGMWRDVYKDPVTDSGKRSKGGRMSLYRGSLGYVTLKTPDHARNELVDVFSYGSVIKEYTFREIRQLAQDFSLLPY